MEDGQQMCMDARQTTGCAQQTVDRLTATKITERFFGSNACNIDECSNGSRPDGTIHFVELRYVTFNKDVAIRLLDAFTHGTRSRSRSTCCSIRKHQHSSVNDGPR